MSLFLKSLTQSLHSTKHLIQAAQIRGPGFVD